MMAIDVPSIDEILETKRATLNALDDTVVASNDSEIGLRMRQETEATYGVYNAASAVHDDLFVTDKVSSESLEKHAEARLGSGARKGATVSSGIDALTVVGTVGVQVEAGEPLSYTDGTEYQTSEDFTIPAAGTINISVESTTTGVVANRDVGNVLTFDSPPAGITAEATLIVKLDGAVDVETDPELIARILDAYRNPPGGGRFSDFRQWATAVDGVKEAYVYGPSSADTDGRRGLGTVDVAILKVGTGASRIPGTATKTAVEIEIDDLRPCTTRDWLLHLPNTTTQAIALRAEPETGYEFDYVESVFRTVNSWTPSTRTIALSGTVDPNMSAGDRVSIEGQIVVVESLGASSFVVETAPDSAPVFLDNVEPGGPLSTPIQTAIEAYFDALGPAKGTAADPEQVWEDRVLIAGLIDTVMSVPGVANVIIDTPGADVTPTDPGGSSAPNLMVYGRIRLTVI